MPAIGVLAGRDSLSVVQPIGQQCLLGGVTEVHTFDSMTGSPQWVFRGPTQTGLWQAGEKEGEAMRKEAGLRPTTLPNPWGAPSIADGIVYVGNEMGPIYALRDLNADGKVIGDAEVSSFDTKACFCGSSGPAHAPGMMVVASIDTMYVFGK